MIGLVLSELQPKVILHFSLVVHLIQTTMINYSHFLEKKFVGTGRESERQLWRIVPGGGESNSVIHNYARGKALSLVLDVPWGTSAKPLQMWSLHGGSEQSFSTDIV